MNTENIQSIGELIEPSPIQFGLGAPGWYLLLALLFLIILVIAVWQFYKYKKNKYRRIAISEILEVGSSQKTVAEIITDVIAIIKRVALRSYNREEVASINGREFIVFLQTKTKEIVFSKNSEEIFVKHLYQGKKASISSEELEVFYKESINWINKHNV